MPVHKLSALGYLRVTVTVVIVTSSTGSHVFALVVFFDRYLMLCGVHKYLISSLCFSVCSLLCCATLSVL